MCLIQTCDFCFTCLTLWMNKYYLLIILKTLPGSEIWQHLLDTWLNVFLLWLSWAAGGRSSGMWVSTKSFQGSYHRRLQPHTSAITQDRPSWYTMLATTVTDWCDQRPHLLRKLQMYLMHYVDMWMKSKIPTCPQDRQLCTAQESLFSWVLFSCLFVCFIVLII